MPFFDDFELVEVGEEEEEQPHMVPGSRVWGAEGHACRVVSGVSAPPSPSGPPSPEEITARPGRDRNTGRRDGG